MDAERKMFYTALAVVVVMLGSAICAEIYINCNCGG